jgi:hypothetical protein
MQDLDLQILANLANKLSQPERQVPLQHLVAVFGYPHKVIFNLKLGMTASAVFHGQAI